MLVVTIIIAAVVSGFAGSMSGSVSTTQQATIKATFSQESGMTISHAGGDVLGLSGLTFATMPSEVMGSGYEQFYWEINPVILNFTSSDGTVGPIMDNASGFYYKTAFVPGDVLTIIPEECNDYASDADLIGTSKNNPWSEGGSLNYNAQVFWGGSDSKLLYYRSYEFDNPENVGKYFYLIVKDSSETIISKTKVHITA